MQSTYIWWKFCGYSWRLINHVDILEQDIDVVDILESISVEAIEFYDPDMPYLWEWGKMVL